MTSSAAWCLPDQHREIVLTGESQPQFEMGWQVPDAPCLFARQACHAAEGSFFFVIFQIGAMFDLRDRERDPSRRYQLC